MKNFLKYTLATIVGIFFVNFVILFLFISFVGAVSILTEQEVIVQNNSILRMKLNTEIMDRTSNDPFENIDFLSMNPRPTLGLNNILSSIKNAANDPKIVGIFLDLTEIQGSYGSLATAAEIRNALKEFKKSGKFIYSYSNLGYSQISYYLGSIAHKIFVNPEAPLLLNGMSSSISFYKESLEK